MRIFTNGVLVKTVRTVTPVDLLIAAFVTTPKILRKQNCPKRSNSKPMAVRWFLAILTMLQQMNMVWIVTPVIMDTHWKSRKPFP
jgi:hypothetical protein